MTNPATEMVYVWAAYGAAILIVAAMVFWTLAEARRQQRALAELESAGVRRRSASAGTSKDI
jgi:heme exporter protein D